MVEHLLCTQDVIGSIPFASTPKRSHKMNFPSADVMTLCMSAMSALATCTWVIRNWRLRREDFPRIDIDCRVNEVSRNQTHTMVEIVAEVKNTGSVRHKIRNICYTLRGACNDSLAEGDETQLSQVMFPVEIRHDQRFFPASWVYSFVDAGNTSTYRNVILVPNDVDVFHLTVRMQYDDKESDFHSASWTGGCDVS